MYIRSFQCKSGNIIEFDVDTGRAIKYIRNGKVSPLNELASDYSSLKDMPRIVKNGMAREITIESKYLYDIDDLLLFTK